MVSRNLQKLASLAILAILLGIVPFASADQITVAAAGDLNFVLKELAKRFEQKTGHVVQISFGSSGNLASQIANGAPFDVFLSADIQYPRQLIASGSADSATLYRYGRGTLVLWVPQSSPFDPSSQKQQLLADKRVRRVAIANPRHAPYGRAAESALKGWGLSETVRPKLVIGENITQTAQFVQSGNADVGLIALSLVLAGSMQGKYWQVPDDAYPAIEQGAVLVSSSRHRAAAEAFLAYLKTPEAKKLLEKYGFRQ